MFVTKLVWDSTDDAREAETAFEQYNTRRFGEESGQQTWTGEDGTQSVLIRDNDLLYWIIAPEGYDVQSLLNLVSNGSAV